jgi:transcriptional regulator with XRE-family HTH domain
MLNVEQSQYNRSEFMIGTGIRMHKLGEFITWAYQQWVVKYPEKDKFTDFADAVGVDASTLSRWTSPNPPKEPSYTLLVGLSKASGTDLCTILGYVAPPGLVEFNPRLRLIAQALADLSAEEQEQIDDQLALIRTKRAKKGK